MTFKLDPHACQQIRTLLSSNASTIVEMAQEIGADPKTFFEGEDWSNLDLRPCDLNGISFAGAVMDGVTVYPDQERAIRVTKPKSMSKVVLIERQGVRTPVNKDAPKQLPKSPEETAAEVIKHIDLGNLPNTFAAMRDIQREWYERGHDKEIRFYLEVSIILAHETCTYARNADEHGTALDDLGTALATLGERENSTERLKQAVDTFQDALIYSTRNRVPLKWAATQNNLGNALQALGERKSSTGRLKQAVDAFRNALLEWTRDRVPLKWAGAQNNLGNALSILGHINKDTVLLEQAVSAFQNALLEYTRDRVPLDWAMTQNNLGDTLRFLSESSSDTTKLEQAIDAFRSALLEWTRDRVPLDWALSTGNLALALSAIGERQGDVATLDAAIASCGEVVALFDEAAPAYAEKARSNLEAIRATRARVAAG